MSAYAMLLTISLALFCAGIYSFLVGERSPGIGFIVLATSAFSMALSRREKKNKEDK